MPLLANLVTWVGTSILGWLTAIMGAKAAVRIAAVMSLAGIYISCVVYFTTLVGPWLAGAFATGYGQVLGLLFPPVSGTVIAGLFGYYTCVAGVRYVSMLTKLAVG